MTPPLELKPFALWSLFLERLANIENEIPDLKQLIKAGATSTIIEMITRFSRLNPASLTEVQVCKPFYGE